MTSTSLTGNCTALLDPGKYNGSHAWGNCPQCIEPNADIAGIGVIVGIVGQAFLLVVAVFGWWIVNVPLRWKRVSNIFNSGTVSTRVLSWIGIPKEGIQKVLLISFDIQVATGLALTTAGLIQFRANPPISTYHACIISDLLSISANGQAAMLFYAIGPEDTRSREVHFRLKKLAPRIGLALTYVGVFFAWSVCLYYRFISPVDARDCLINLPPQNGNYGGWSFGEATLMLFFVILAILQGRLRSLVPPEHRQWRRFFKILYDSFPPIFIMAYFIWNFADIVDLKSSNKDFLTDNSESRIEAFGQVIPIVLLLLPCLTLWDVFTKDVEPPRPGSNVPAPQAPAPVM